MNHIFEGVVLDLSTAGVMDNMPSVFDCSKELEQYEAIIFLKCYCRSTYITVLSRM